MISTKHLLPFTLNRIVPYMYPAVVRVNMMGKISKKGGGANVSQMQTNWIYTNPTTRQPQPYSPEFSIIQLGRLSEVLQVLNDFTMTTP